MNPRGCSCASVSPPARFTARCQPMLRSPVPARAGMAFLVLCWAIRNSIIIKAALPRGDSEDPAGQGHLDTAGDGACGVLEARGTSAVHAGRPAVPSIWAKLSSIPLLPGTFPGHRWKSNSLPQLSTTGKSWGAPCPPLSPPFFCHSGFTLHPASGSTFSSAKSAKLG